MIYPSVISHFQDNKIPITARLTHKNELPFAFTRVEVPPGAREHVQPEQKGESTTSVYAWIILAEVRCTVPVSKTWASLAPAYMCSKYRGSWKEHPFIVLSPKIKVGRTCCDLNYSAVPPDSSVFFRHHSPTDADSGGKIQRCVFTTIVQTAQSRTEYNLEI